MKTKIHESQARPLINKIHTAELQELSEVLIAELPSECKDCPAAFVCQQAMVSGEGISYPETPADVRRMQVNATPGGGYSLLSGQAQWALHGIVSEANEKNDPGPSDDGTICCLDPNHTIDIYKPNASRGW